MTTTTFLIMLASFSVLSGLVVEAIKKVINEKENVSYNLIALGVSLIIGFVGTMTYYQLNYIPLVTNNVIYAVLMGFASALVAMTSYDKVVQCIKQLSGM